ncbi:hemogen isoform X2 [Hemicordylus capensis]|uniref:hemogen isoform X2 n=1 Tax=Hemicordylus capensis TaxID=884348 RepID=UPI002303A8A6|nr:hemogen isoform X2 [Hemicordylus capensis]
MASLEKDHSYSGNPQQPLATTEEYATSEVVVTRRLRDRELLRKRKAEAEEKDTHQWVLGVQKTSKQARRGRGAGRGRGQRKAPELEAEQQPAGAEETHEPPVASLEEKVEITPDPPVETSVSLVEAESLHTPKEVDEAAPTGSSVCPVEQEETPRSEEPANLESLQSDTLGKEFSGSFFI